MNPWPAIREAPTRRASTPALPRVLWAGVATGEFADAYAATSARSVVTLAPHVGAVTGHLRRSKPIDVIVVACQHPVACSRSLDLVRQAAGDAKLVQLLGVWCEGEGRTGQVIEGYERVFWHQLDAWWITHGSATSSCPSPPHSLLEGGAVALSVADSGLAAAIKETLASDGVATAAIESAPSHPTAVIWDGSQLDGREADELARLCRWARRRETPVLAMLDFPRPETVAAAKALGAEAVFGKPFDSATLIATLADLAKRSWAKRSRTARLPRRLVA